MRGISTAHYEDGTAHMKNHLSSGDGKEILHEMEVCARSKR